MSGRLYERPTNRPSLAYAALAFAVLFGVLTAFVVARQTSALDLDLILSLRSGAEPWLTAMFLAITFTSGKLAIPAAIAFAITLYYRGDARGAAYYAGTCIAAQLLNAILKYSVARPRPHGISPRLTAAGGMSYPSADAMLAVVIFGLGTYMVSETIRSQAVSRSARALAAAFIVLAAIARVYLGAHWPTDVLGGTLAGLACATFGFAVLRRPPEILIPVAETPPALPGAESHG
ncbi:MAG: phosphatase PAP2 family protein [Gemmatimonadaceae bacterium]